jgi:hypothetical protein
LVRGLEAVTENLWAVTDAGIYFVELGEKLAMFQPYDPRAVVMSRPLGRPSRACPFGFLISGRAVFPKSLR